MKRVLLGLLLAISGGQAAPAAAATPVAGESVLTMRVDGELTIGTEGQVLSYKIRSKLDPTLQAMLDKSIPRWHLAPVRQGGKPVNAKTPMRITLAASTCVRQRLAMMCVIRFANSAFASRSSASGRPRSAKTLPELPSQPGFHRHWNPTITHDHTPAYFCVSPHRTTRRRPRALHASSPDTVPPECSPVADAC